MSKEKKIYPRNATAKSHSMIEGNPVTTRPESGVDNSYPGLEFDQRNIDKRFFPGMEFEFHSGAVLRSINDNLDEKIKDIILDSELESGLVLLAVNGIFGNNEVKTVKLREKGGLNDWRMIHDLEEGPLSIALIPHNEKISREKSVLAFEKYINSGDNTIVVERDKTDDLIHIFVSGNRARYLNENGVIDPAEYSPGELTRSLCSPWQYDFALCGCFYWASNKPDMVKKDSDSPQLSSFQRRRSTPDDSLVEPIIDYEKWERDGSNNISEQEMINDWEQLPAVFNAIESKSIKLEGPFVYPQEELLDRKKIISTLRELATVEHGLMIEYLYAYYSIDTQAYGDNSDEESKLTAAADTILSIAIDEMRHLRWVNEILLILGEEHELGRFELIPDINHKFSLEPLTPERLQWFINVEAPSDKIGFQIEEKTVDGMYTNLLTSITKSKDFKEEKDKILNRIKTIIDEGHDHYLRFLRVQKLLTNLDSDVYLQTNSKPSASTENKEAYIYEKIADSAYYSVLLLLKHVFVSTNLKSISTYLIGAREFMYNLDEAASKASKNGGSPLFTLPIVGDLETKSVGTDEIKLSEFIDKQIIPDFKRTNTKLFEKLTNDPEIELNMIKRFESASNKIKELESVNNEHE